MLEDGSVFRGRSIGAVGVAVGEVVFNTSMTGYQEILTDPSYARQIVTLTYPHIGNTGANKDDMESHRAWAEGLVIRDLPIEVSSWRAESDLATFLADQSIPAIAEIDTRRLTRLIRTKGALAGCLVAGDAITEEAALAQARDFPGLRGMDLAQVVTRDATTSWREGTWDLEAGYREPSPGRYHVVAYDFGVKHNILRMLTARGARVTVVPAATSASDALALEPDGIFLSNGPGDPEPVVYAVDAIREFLARKIPMFGICLGHQLLALANGASTVKMPHGHHGANHPVQDLETGAVIITSQNHGFAVDEATLPNHLVLTHKSLFDGTVQGVRIADAPVFGFQGHPEASPGPQDCDYLFDRFIAAIADKKPAPQEAP